ncbi:hypothetical protein GEMRC1_008078 [Eukaryota sp. GEM-RC1]
MLNIHLSHLRFLYCSFQRHNPQSLVKNDQIEQTPTDYENADYDEKTVTVTVADDDKVRDVDLSLTTFEVSGTVTADSVQLQDVAVFVEDVHITDTNEAGLYTLELPNGVYTFRFVLADYDEKTVTVTVADDDKVRDVELSLTTFEVSGTVTADSVQLQDVAVYVEDVHITDTNEAGLYTLELPNGVYTFRFVLADYDEKTVTGTVADDDKVRDVDLSLTTFEVSGTVTADSVQLQDVAVYVNDVHITDTNEAGLYTLELPNGVYTFRFVLADYDEKTVTVTVADDDKVGDVELSLTTFEVFGTVTADSVQLQDVAVYVEDVHITDTNDAGLYTLELPNGVYTFRFVLADYDEKTVTVTVADNEDVDLSLTTFEVSGTVTADSVQLQDVAVYVNDVHITDTNEAGLYTLELPNGVYTFRFVLADYDEKTVTVTVADDDKVRDVDLSLTTFEVSGTVTADSVQLQDVAVYVNDVHITDTNEAGLYTLELPNGVYTFRFVLADYDEKTVTVTVADDDKVRDVDLSLTTFEVSGTVTADSVQLQDVAVYVNDVHITDTNEAGLYTLELPNGVYTFRFVLADYDEKTVTVTVADDDKVRDVDLSLTTFEVSGTVTADSVQLQDVAVYVNDVHITATNEAGLYTLELSNGVYTFRFVLADYDEKTVTVTVADDDKVRDVELSLTTFEVSGTVTADSVQLQDVAVYVNDVHITDTNEAGPYTLELPNGVYTFRFVLADYDETTVTVTVADDDKVRDVDLSLTTFEVSGTVTADSVQLQHVAVYVNDVHITDTNEAGLYTLELPNGVYTFRFVLADYDEKTVTVTVADDDNVRDVELSLTTFEVSGTITADSVQLQNVAVYVNDVHIMDTNEAGLYTLELPNGVYTFRFVLADYDEKTVTVTVADDDKVRDVELSLTTFKVSGTVTADSVQLQDVIILGQLWSAIDDSAFGHNQLMSVQFGHSLQEIGDYAFEMNNLESLKFNSLQSILMGTFDGNPLAIAEC